MGPLYREHDAQLRARVPHRKWREREGLCNVHLDLLDLFPRTSLSTRRLEKLLGNVASQEERPQMMNIQDSPTKNTSRITFGVIYLELRSPTHMFNVSNQLLGQHSSM